MKKILALAMALIALSCIQAAAQGKVVKFEEPKLTVFLPPQPNGRAIVACPGGGYTHLATAHEGYNWAPFFNNLGYAYAVLEYRMPGGDREIPMADVRAAFKIMGDSASQWHFDSDKIGIMGSSAGGHLASIIATHPTDGCRPAFQILFYPVISLDKSITHMGTRKGFLGENPTDELVSAWSSQNNVSAETAPAFMALSGDDRAVPPANSIGYFNALISAGVPATMHIYPSGGHGWGYRTAFPYHGLVLAELTNWLGNLKFEGAESK